jgi:hypothetical protein
MNPFCAWMIIEWSLIKFVCFVMIWNPRWPLPQDIVLTQDHMGKYRNIFFSEVIALIEPKLCINHWKVLYKLCVFYCDRNSKMTTTAGHSFLHRTNWFFLWPSERYRLWLHYRCGVSRTDNTLFNIRYTDIHFPSFFYCIRQLRLHLICVLDVRFTCILSISWQPYLVMEETGMSKEDNLSLFIFW